MPNPVLQWIATEGIFWLTILGILTCMAAVIRDKVRESRRTPAPVRLTRKQRRDFERSFYS